MNSPHRREYRPKVVSRDTIGDMLTKGWSIYDHNADHGRVMVNDDLRGKVGTDGRPLEVAILRVQADDDSGLRVIELHRPA